MTKFMATSIFSGNKIFIYYKYIKELVNKELIQFVIHLRISQDLKVYFRESFNRHDYRLHKSKSTIFLTDPV